MLVFSNMKKMSIVLEIAEWLISKGGYEELEKFFCIAWGLWGRWNKMQYENQSITPTQVIEVALAIQESF